MKPPPGSRYRETPYGWEPAAAWPALEPAAPRRSLSALIGETVALGVPPRQAAKWWLYIAAEWRRRVLEANRGEEEAE